MAIEKIAENAEKIQITINNGDLRALKEITETWALKDKESALRFAIAVLKITRPMDLFRREKDGEKIAVMPGDILMKHPGENREQETDGL